VQQIKDADSDAVLTFEFVVVKLTNPSTTNDDDGL
jgi:hypothetical protein